MNHHSHPPCRALSYGDSIEMIVNERSGLFITTSYNVIVCRYILLSSLYFSVSLRVGRGCKESRGCFLFASDGVRMRDLFNKTAYLWITGCTRE